MKSYIKRAIYNYRAKNIDSYNEYQKNLMNERNYWKRYYDLERELKMFRNILKN